MVKLQPTTFKIFKHYHQRITIMMFFYVSDNIDDNINDNDDNDNNNQNLPNSRQSPNNKKAVRQLKLLLAEVQRASSHEEKIFDHIQSAKNISLTSEFVERALSQLL